MIKERAQGALSMLRANTAKMKAVDLDELTNALKDVDWKTFRDVQIRSAKDAVAGVKRMRRDDAAERRSVMVLAAAGAGIGAALMYFLDPANGGSRRSSLRDRLTRWYRRGRGQLDRSRHDALLERARVDLTEKARTDGSPDGSGQSREEAAAPRR